MSETTRPAVGGQLDQPARPNAQAVADHVEQRLRTWRQQHMNRSGDRLALDDFMCEDSIADLVDYVCDQYALEALLRTEPVAAERERMRALIADDASAATYQTMGQYRAALLRALKA